MKKIWYVLLDEIGSFHVRLFFSRIVLSLLPISIGKRFRVLVLRLAGIKIGKGSILWGSPRIVGHKKGYHNLLQIGDHCMMNFNCLFDLADQITIGNRVTFGPEVALITGAHEIGDEQNRLGPLSPRPIVIGDGVWLGTRCVILPGVTIGRGSVVAAGAVVVKDVLPNTLVGGVPARVIRELEVIAPIDQNK